MVSKEPRDMDGGFVGHGGLKRIVQSRQCFIQRGMNCRMLYRKYCLYRVQPFLESSERKQEGGIHLE